MAANDFPAFLASLEQLKRRIEQGSADALREHCDNVLETSQADGVVPVQSGRLRASGFAEGPLVGSGKATCRIGFDTPYALLVHEQPQSARKTGRAKFLEATITAKAGEFGPILKAKVGA